MAAVWTLKEVRQEYLPCRVVLCRTLGSLPWCSAVQREEDGGDLSSFSSVLILEEMAEQNRHRTTNSCPVDKEHVADPISHLLIKSQAKFLSC